VLHQDDADRSPLTQKIVQDWVKPAARRAKVVPEGVHVLRHTFCSHLAMRGAPARATLETGCFLLGSTSEKSSTKPIKPNTAPTVATP
jgi:site-specific recombinase XerD